MFKNDTMEQYVTDRHPHLAPRTVWDRIDWTAAAVVQDARQRAVATISRPAAPVFNLPEFRLARRPLPIA